MKIPVQLARQAEEHEESGLRELYIKLFSLGKNKLFQEGRIEKLELNAANNPLCFGFHRFTEKNHAFILANFGATGIEIELHHPLTGHISQESLNLLSTEGINKTCAILGNDRTLRLRLSAHEGVVMTF